MRRPSRSRCASAASASVDFWPMRTRIFLRDDADRRPMALAAGQFSMHHGLVPHRSGPNTSPNRRVGLAFHYTATSTKPAGRIRQAAMLVRGDDRHRHFEEVPPPTSELSPEAIAIHDRAVGLYREAYLEAEAAHDLQQTRPRLTQS